MWIGGGGALLTVCLDAACTSLVTAGGYLADSTERGPYAVPVATISVPLHRHLSLVADVVGALALFQAPLYEWRDDPHAFAGVGLRLVGGRFSVDLGVMDQLTGSVRLPILNATAVF